MGQECLNTLYKYGLNNDKIVLLFEETKHAKIVIKTAMGITDRICIKNLISVWKFDMYVSHGQTC